MDTPGAICWFCGKLLTVIFILLFFGATVFWTFSEKKGVLFELNGWSQEAKYLIVITYFYLISSYILAILSVSYVFQAPAILEIMALYPKTIIITSLILMTVLTPLLEYVPYNKKESSLLKNGLWILHSTAMGPALAYFGSFICVESIIKVSIVFIIATVVSFTAPKNSYEEIKIYIQQLYSIVTIGSVLCFLFNPPVNIVSILLLVCNLFGGMVLYFGVFVTNTQYMLNQVHENNFDPVYTAAVMYLCTLNFYLRVAMYYVVELTDIAHKDGCNSLEVA